MSTDRLPFEAPVGSTGRATLLGMAAFLIVGFATALWLSPDPQGYGTHQQLGLPPCTFRTLFGIPCPGCGMTTCFSHFVRGHFVAAAHASLAGVVLAFVCALLIPWCFWSAYLGRCWKVSDPVAAACVMTTVLCGLAIALWLIRVTWPA